MKDLIASVQAELFAMQDIGYRDFQSRLMPTVPKERVIGVRTPELRRYASAFSRRPEALQYLSLLPHTYYEENNLHAFLIERLRDFDGTVAALDRFLPFVDNWATCDMMSPKIFARRQEELLPHVRRWMTSGQTYTVRFGIGMMLRYYLGDRFSPTYPEEVARLCGEEYYVNMMIAWYFATALAFQYPVILPYIAEHRLSPWVHEKTVRKAIESYRLTPQQKDELCAYRRWNEKSYGTF